MIDFSVLYALLVLVGVILFTRIVMPYLRKNNLELYEEVKLVLLLFGYSFRDEKIKNIIKIAEDLITDLETIAISPEDKLEVAVIEVSKKLIKDFNIDLDDDILKAIIRVVVSTLPPTNAPIK